jgi:hypothetical protein
MTPTTRGIDLNLITLNRAVWIVTLSVFALVLSSIALLFLVPKPANSSTWLDPGLQAIAALGAPILSLVILRHQPRNRIGWLWLVYALGSGLSALALGYFYLSGSRPTGYPLMGSLLLWLSEPAKFASFICLMLVLLWFPDGQLPGRRWRFMYLWMLVAFPLWFSYFFVSGTQWNIPTESGSIIIDNPFGFFSQDAEPLISTFLFVGFLSYLGLLLLAGISLRFRYRSAGQQVRSQIRWFVLSGTLYVASFLSSFFPPIPTTIGLLITDTTLVFLYLSIGMAILRYKLYDIDVIIRRTILYTILSVVLALVYFGSVSVLQEIFAALGGAQSTVATVISTLGIAALFNPLRGHLQNVIDRRFYRKKYDTEQTLKAFSSNLSQEIDPEGLSHRLLSAVEETFEPAYTALWLREQQ